MGRGPIYCGRPWCPRDALASPRLLLVLAPCRRGGDWRQEFGDHEQRQFSSREAGGEDTAAKERAECPAGSDKGPRTGPACHPGQAATRRLVAVGDSSAGPSMLSHGGQTHGSKLQPAISIQGPRGSTHVLMITYGECVPHVRDATRPFPQSCRVGRAEMESPSLRSPLLPNSYITSRSTRGGL